MDAIREITQASRWDAAPFPSPPGNELPGYFQVSLRDIDGSPVV
jgi:hypothetical protein